MSDQPENGGEEIPPVEGETAAGGDEAVVPDLVDPAPASEAIDEPPPPAEEAVPVEEPPSPAEEEKPVEEPPPPAEEAEPVEEPPPPAEEAEPVEEPPPPAEEAKPVEEPPPPAEEAKPVEEPPPPAENVEPPGEPPPAEEAGELVEASGDAQQDDAVAPTDDGQVFKEGSTSSATRPEGATDDDGGGEQKPSSKSASRESTQSEIQALTTTQILGRLKKSYAQACKTLSVIANIQRRESILKLEEQQMELIKKFSKFEGHLEELGLTTEQATQTSPQRTSVPSEDLKPPTLQDNLPQVIICGRQEQVPKIIVCDSPNKSNHKKSPAELERERSLKTQKELVSKCEFMREKLMLKETMVCNLHRQICGLQKENFIFRRQLAAKSNQTQQPCPGPGTTQAVCLASCPLHCRPNGPRADSPELQVSKVSTKIETQKLQTLQCSNCRPGSVCAPTCPNFKENVTVVDSKSTSKEDSKSTSLCLESQQEGTAQQHVCPPRCPYFKANLPVIKEETKATSLCPESQQEGTTQEHVCPPRCPYNKANSSVVKENAKSTSCEPEGQSKGMAQQHVCPLRCPYFKANSSVVTEESKIPQQTGSSPENASKHVCSTKCPYFNINLPTVSECQINAQMPPDAADRDVENVEVEIQEHTLGSHKDIVPCDGDKEPNAELCNRCHNKHIPRRLCDSKKPKQPTFCELKKEYNCLKKDFDNRMVELEDLQKDIVKHKDIAEQACVAQQRAEIEVKTMSDILKSIEDKQLMMMVPKERMMEMEQQIVVAKERFLESQDELEELRELTQRQTTQLDEYRGKYLQSHEQVEDQKGQIEMLELENSRISENVALEIQHVKNQFEVRLQALAPLPDLLKASQERVQELQRGLEEGERRVEGLDRELRAARERARQLDDSVTTSSMELEGHQGSTRKQLAKWQEKYDALSGEAADLRRRLTDEEAAGAGLRVRLTEKLHEVAQLTAALDALRVESARQVSRAKERLGAVRAALDAQIVQLEERVAESNAGARTASKDRDNIRQRMQAQIDSLYESFEQAQITIRSLQEQVGFFNDNN